MDDTKHNRSRQSPADRFEGPEHLIDLNSVAADLLREPPPPHGHRQVAVFKRDRVTVSLFAFDAGAGLPEHHVNGVVTIQGLDGRITITTPTGDHHLTPGKLLTLDPGGPHSVHAPEPGRMLVTVCLLA